MNPTKKLLFPKPFVNTGNFFYRAVMKRAVTTRCFNFQRFKQTTQKGDGMMN
jgi:hypothetical protein